MTRAKKPDPVEVTLEAQKQGFQIITVRTAVECTECHKQIATKERAAYKPSSTPELSKSGVAVPATFLHFPQCAKVACDRADSEVAKQFKADAEYDAQQLDIETKINKKAPTDESAKPRRPTFIDLESEDSD